MENNDTYWSKLRQLGIFSMAFPVLILIAGVLMERRGMPALIENFDTGTARIVQYILFAMGVIIFFFCDGISDFFANRFFVHEKEERENLSAYVSYVFIVMWMLNVISISGFVGFLICRNLAWLTLFVILTLTAQMRYFPSNGRFNKLIELVK